MILCERNWPILKFIMMLLCISSCNQLRMILRQDWQALWDKESTFKSTKYDMNGLYRINYKLCSYYHSYIQLRIESFSMSSSSSCSWRVRRVSCSLILKMKLVPPSLPRSSYVPSSFFVDIVMLVLAFYLCPSSVRVIFNVIILNELADWTSFLRYSDNRRFGHMSVSRRVHICDTPL